MVSNASDALKVYKKIDKAGDSEKSPYEIVKMILDELSRTMHLLILEIDKKNAFLISKNFKDIRSVQSCISKYVTRSLTTIYSLQTSLDFEKGGEITKSLFQLYEFCRQQIIKAFSNNDNNGLKKAFDALNEIISAWSAMKV